MKNLIINALILLSVNFIDAQDSLGRYHLQTFSSIMEIDSTSRINSITLDKYLTEHWDGFILSKNKKNYFQEVILGTELLIFQNHNLFSPYPIKLLEDNFEHFFYFQGDSIVFWFGGMKMPHSITIMNDSTTYLLFPTNKKESITVITKVSEDDYIYTYYHVVNDVFYIKKEVKRKSKFKHKLGIRNKNDLMVLLFDNIEN